MEIFNRETNPRDGDDDEEESGTAGNKRPKKESWRREEDADQDKYRSLHHGASGEFFLPRQEGVFDHLLEESEDDEEDEDDKKADEAVEEPGVEHEASEPDKSISGSAQAEEISEEPQPEETQEVSHIETEQPAANSEEEQPAETKENQRQAETQSPRTTENRQAADTTENIVQSTPQESFTGQGQEKPKWLEEDEQKFQKIMEREADESFKKAASSATLTSQEPGKEPPAIERTTNESVSLEPEPTHQVEGFRDEQQFEGVAPGPARYVESVAQEAHEPGTSGQATISQPNIIKPSSDEDLSRRLDRLDLRHKMAVPLIVTMAVYGYLANKRRKREIRHQDKEFKQSAKEHRNEAERMAGEQQEMRSRLEAQREQLARVQTQQRAAQEMRGFAAGEQGTTPVSSDDVPRYERTGAVPPANVQKPPEARTIQGPKYAVPGPSAEAARATGLGSEKDSDEDNKPDTEAARRAVEQAREAMTVEKPQRHIEQDAWRRYVVDEQGHEVHEAMRYGREYDDERAQETLSGNAAPHTDPRHYGQGQPVYGGSWSPQAHGKPTQEYDHEFDSGHVPADHILPAGMPEPSEWQNRTPHKKPDNPIVAALTSPWLFLMLSLILLAYFIATLL